MTELYLIEGGRDASAADRMVALAAVPFLPLMARAAAEQFAAQAEENALAAVGQVTAAVAILTKSKVDLVSLIAAAGQEQAADGHATLRRALASADVLVAVLRAAETRFTIAQAAAASHADYFP
jgi:hypothetical protein